MLKTKAKHSQDFLDTIKGILLLEKERLEGELAGFAKKNSHMDDDFEAEFPEYGNEEDDNAREIADYTANKPLEMTLEKSLRDVVVSLERMKEGKYGFCKYCSQPIEEKRLLARPTSSTCIECKKTLTQEA